MSATDLYCPGDARRDALRARPIPRPVNGIDWIEVLPSKRALLAHCFGELGAAIGPAQVRIEGGARVRVEVAGAFRADQAAAAALVPADKAVVDALTAAERTAVLVVRADSSGDFSEYVLRLVASTSPSAPPPAGFDALLSELSFSFKVDCDSQFDCRDERRCPPEEWPAPRIDYLAKDYASFRRLLLDRLAQTVPQWRERNPADLQVTLVELIAFVADRLSYHQDAVATEAYLGTARRRSSVRRHARLVDYRLHEGCNARTWIALQAAGNAAQPVPAGSYVLTSEPPGGGAAVDVRVLRAVAGGAVAFRTRHAIAAHPRRSLIDVYTWGDAECCLPRGATRATLVETVPPLALTAGTVLLFEEVRGHDGEQLTADPAHRHAVRLRADGVTRSDPLTGTDVVEVAWHAADALPFALALDAYAQGPAVVVHGNVVLADHGVWTQDDPVVVPKQGRFRPLLAQPGLTYASPYRHESALKAPAREATRVLLDRALPALEVVGEDASWTPAPAGDLLASDAFAADVVVEMEEDGSAAIRFGDGRHGRRPAAKTFVAHYRVGNGTAGNVGSGALTVLVDGPAGVTATNPIAATGGTEREPLEDVRQYAPQAFRRQERAVTAADYAAAAERHPEVQRAAATRRWTGSWHTMFVTIDRLGGGPVDADFEARMRAHLDRFRMAGYDLEIDGPKLVAVDLKLWLCLSDHASRTTVARALRAALREHFHPDRFTFGQPVYLAPIIAIAMGIPGVRQVTPLVFGRWRETRAAAGVPAVLELGPLEVARLDDDRSAPEPGRIDFELAGGA